MSKRVYAFLTVYLIGLYKGDVGQMLLDSGLSDTRKKGGKPCLFYLRVDKLIPTFWTGVEVMKLKKLKFFMEMDPPTATHQMHKVRVVNGHPMFYEPSNVKDARKKLMVSLMANVPSEIFSGPVELKVRWHFPKGKSHKAGTWRITKPDTDNLEKLLKDCMTKMRFWNDDAQVAREIAEKCWSDEPCGIEIEISEMEEFCDVQK